jgi:hypothetical protein
VLIVIAAAGLALIVLLSWFYMLELRDERHTIFLVLVFTLIVEAVLAGPAADVPIGILRPRVGGQDFRPPDLVIVAALGAHLVAGRGRRVTGQAAAWGAFVAVYVLGVAIGMLNDLPMLDVLYQGKAAFYLVGGMVVASGADVRRVFDSIGKFGVALAVLVPVGMAVRTAGLQFTIETPIQRLRGLGLLSNDSITILVLIGAAVVVTEACRRTPRLVVLVSGGVLLLAPIAGKQRASYLVLGFVVVALAVLQMGVTWRRRSAVTTVEVLLGCAALFGVVVAGFLATASPGVIGAQVDDAFGGANEQRSAQSRVELYGDAVSEIADNPVIGSGVGTTVLRRIESTQEERPAAAHNLVLDIMLRTGLVGLALLAVALAASTARGVSIWRSNIDNAVAAVAISCVIVMLGVVTKGMVEPALDKFRLSLLLGVSVGALLASASSAQRWSGSDAAAPERLEVP